MKFHRYNSSFIADIIHYHVFVFFIYILVFPKMENASFEPTFILCVNFFFRKKLVLKQLELFQGMEGEFPKMPTTMVKFSTQI